MGISINGPSGIDTSYIIDSLVEIEKAKVTKVEKQKDVYQKKADAYSTILSFVKEIGTKASKLMKESDYNLFKINSSNDTIVTLTGDTSGSPGSYDIQVFQTAQREKLISRQNGISSQSTSLVSQGFTAGRFTINGTEIELDDNDTIQDLRSKINNATNASGEKIGVTASVLKVADNDFRLVLSASASGSAGAEYRDVDTGTVLQRLGIITNAAGNKGITNHTIGSDDNLRDLFAGLAPNETIEFGGTDHEGNAVTGSFTITGTSTIDDFLKYIEKEFHGMVTASIDVADGSLTIASKNGGQSKLAMTSFTMGGASRAFTTDVAGVAGQNVLTSGKDAIFSVDSMIMSSSSNSAKNIITGVTIELKKASVNEQVSVSLDRDYDGLAAKIEDLVNAYNAFVKFVKEQTVYGDEEKGQKKGVLAGDSTARSIVEQVKSVFQQKFDVDGTSLFTSLSSIGLKTNTTTGAFEIDKTVLADKMKDNFDEVLKVFITRGTSSNSSIILGRYGDKTEDGSYQLTESGDLQSYTISRASPASSDLSDPRQGDVVSFANGPATGLSLTAPAGSGGGTFVFSRGFAGHLERMTKQLTDGVSGAVVLRQQSWLTARDNLDDRIIKLNDRAERYRVRLVNEFTNMEKVLNNLNGQSSNMLSQLGYYSNNK